jgi:hypothetical protein
MAEELKPDPEAGTIGNPLHPCYKAPHEGLCKRRKWADSRFQCFLEPRSCPDFVMAEAVKEGEAYHNENPADFGET